MAGRVDLSAAFKPAWFVFPLSKRASCQGVAPKQVGSARPEAHKAPADIISTSSCKWKVKLEKMEAMIVVLLLSLRLLLAQRRQRKRRLQGQIALARRKRLKKMWEIHQYIHQDRTNEEDYSTLAKRRRITVSQ